MDTPDFTTEPKQCRKCGQFKPATPEFFPFEKRIKGGLNTICRVCESIRHEGMRRKRGQSSRPRAIRKDGRRVCTACKNEYPETPDYFYPKSSGAFKAKCINCSREYANHRRERLTDEQRKAKAEYMQRYAQLPHRKETQAEQNERRKGDPRRREYFKKKRADPEYLASRHRYMKAYSSTPEFREKRRIYENRRRARKHLLPSTLSMADWQHALEYFNHTCAVCQCSGGEALVLAQDHWIPLSRGGSTTPENILPLCHGVGGCNNSKRARDPAEWLTERFGEQKARAILKRIQDYFDSLT